MTTAEIKTYQMSERSTNLEFEIRDWTARNPIITPHRHEFFQIHVNVNGGSRHGIRNKESIYPDKSLIFVLPFRVHFSQPAINPNYHIINFSRNFLGSNLTADIFETEELIALEHPELIPFLYQGLIDFNFTESQFSYVMEILNKLYAINQERKLGWRERIRGIILDLIGFTTELHYEKINVLVHSHDHSPSITESFKRVIQYIDRNIQSDLTLESVAHATFLSASYISQLLKQKTGLAFVGWLTMKRMEKAQELLLMTDNRISQIAKEVGFLDEGYFTRRFRQKFNISPTEYRINRTIKGS